jgi:signal peptidase II
MEQPATFSATSSTSATIGTRGLAAWRRVAPWLALAAAIISVDQGTKAIVRARMDLYEVWPAGWEIIRLQHVQNTGAAFGILQGAGTFLVVSTFIAIVAITVFLLTLPSHGRMYHLALSMILGGAIGNLIDRVRLGAVTDFIDPTHYPAFNLADSSIVCGVALLAFLAFREGNDTPPKEQP